MCRLAVPPALFFALVALASCGSGDTTRSTETPSGTGLSKQEYAKALQGYATAPAVVKPFHHLEGVAQPFVSRKRLAAALASYDAAVKKVSQQIAALHPPSVAASSNDDLVAAINTHEKSVDRTERAVKSGTKQQAEAQFRDYRSSVVRFHSATKKINSRLRSEGIRVPAL